MIKNYKIDCYHRRIIEKLLFYLYSLIGNKLLNSIKTGISILKSLIIVYLISFLQFLI
jgi:hypothetical protein